MTRKPRNIRRRTVLAACLLIWVGVLIATHIPSERMPKLGVSDKFLHTIGYFILAGVFWLTLLVYEVRRPKRILCVFFSMLAYAAMDEITQELVRRQASLYDWLADVVGTVVAIGMLELLARAKARLAPRESPEK